MQQITKLEMCVSDDTTLLLKSSRLIATWHEPRMGGENPTISTWQKLRQTQQLHRAAPVPSDAAAAVAVLPAPAVDVEEPRGAQSDPEALQYQFTTSSHGDYCCKLSKPVITIP